ncbi:hypothetical protein FHS83_003666 [Rhizomicrobium palustre]|uniref:Uncharacterized protein n=1 Tax=Rhizomicrobium palustre TaxID=189966 RepID=A0A846N315_9PROT|nr:hypothetical protein [Rhizomicrobium palustre]NIK90348.1 hypothetical protein [Rhizomicrobium palustre]
MRKTFAVLCFSIIFFVSSGAATPLDEYIAARDRYIVAFAPPKYVDNKRHEKALTDVKARLKTLIGPLSAPGYSKEPELNRDTLVGSDVGFDQLDGLRYAGNGGQVVVSTMPLLRAWLAKRKDRPADLDKLISTEDFFTFTVSNDASATFYGSVPVAAKGRKVAVRLGDYAQETLLDQGPTKLLAAVIDGERVYIAEEGVSSHLAPIPVCQAPMKKTLAEANAAYTSFTAFNQKIRAAFDKYLRLSAAADKGYRVCFAREIRKQKAWPAIKKQAQHLVDSLR